MLFLSKHSMVKEGQGRTSRSTIIRAKEVGDLHGICIISCQAVKIALG